MKLSQLDVDLVSFIFSCASMTGIDISKTMIEHAKIHHEDSDLRLGFKTVDIMKCINARDVFPDGFNKIFSFYCLHWIKDHKYREFSFVEPKFVETDFPFLFHRISWWSIVDSWSICTIFSGQKAKSFWYFLLPIPFLPCTNAWQNGRSGQNT